MHRRWFLGCVAVVLMGGSFAAGQEDGNVIFQMSRTMGFRPAGMMNVQSDYSFQITGEGIYTYNSWAAVNNEPYVVTGRLPEAIEGWEAQLQKLGLDDVPAPDPNEPMIADAPEVTVNRVVNGEPWSRKLEVRSPIAMGLHRLVQQLVMGVVELSLEGAEIKEMETREINDPLVIESAEALQRLFQAGGDAVASQVDFEKHQVLVYRWDGSGGDSLVAWRTGDGDETEISYGMQRGMTRDLRQHIVLLAVPKGKEPKFVELPAARIRGR